MLALAVQTMTLLINNMTLVHDKLLANLHLENFHQDSFQQTEEKIQTRVKNIQPTTTWEDQQGSSLQHQMRGGGWRGWGGEGRREGEGRDPSIFLEAQDKHLWRTGSHLVISGGNISLVLRSRAGGLHQLPPTCRQQSPGGVERREERHGTWFLQW